MERNTILQRIRELEKQLSELPSGTLVYKTIRGKKQPYLQWWENGKQKTRYIKAAGREKAVGQALLRRELAAELKELRSSVQDVPFPETPSGHRTNIVTGDRLDAMTDRVRSFEKRDCYRQLDRFLKSKTPGRVCLLYGLRRTGKTTLLLQAINDLPPEERSHAAYIKARTTDTMRDMEADLNDLWEKGFRYVFLDEVTLLADFIDNASLFSDIFAMMGMKIVLSGRDSLSFWFSLTQELYDRTCTIHTTFISFREYARLLGIEDIDEYIRYGGTLSSTEPAFGNPANEVYESAFRDDETTRRYIDTAICGNIQHSLLCCERGNYFRHLRSLYEAGELTNAINRIIESMNHQFLLSTLTEPFKSHGLGSATEMLRKQPDRARRTDILDHIDRETVTGKLMEMLQIRNREDAKIGITPAHVAEIREYLKALDLITECPRQNMIAEPEDYVLFTQPGMRFSQAQAFVHVLLSDESFQSFPQEERDLARDRILENVRNRMMEDSVLLENIMH